MNLPLVDFATRTPTHTRSLIHGESDRARAGTALAILAADPTGRSARWPLALAAYRQLWTGYKGRAAWRRAGDLLAASLQDFAADREFLKEPDLVAAFLAVDGARLDVAALSTTLVAVRQGREVLELGPDGFRTVPEIGTLQRESSAGLWRASLTLGAGAVLCVMARSAAARVGIFRLREALMSDVAADLLAGLGTLDEPVLAARMNRGAQVPVAAATPATVAAAATAPAVASAPAMREASAPPPVIASPPPVIASPDREPIVPAALDTAPAASRTLPPASAALPPAASNAAPPARLSGGETEETGEEAAAPFLIRSGRRHRAEQKGSWLDRWRGEPAPDTVRPDGEVTSPRSRDLVREQDLFSFAEPEAVAPMAAPEPFDPFAEPEAVAPMAAPESASPMAEPEPFALPIAAPGPSTTYASPGSTPPAAYDLPSSSELPPAVEQDGIVIPTRRIRQQMAGRRGTAQPDEESYLLRRWFTWSLVGLGIVAVLIVLILIGRFLTGGGPEGPRVTGLQDAARPVRTAGSEDGAEDGLPPAAAFTGASWTRTFKDAITSSPLLAADRVIVGGRDGNLYALGVNDGAEAWRLAVGAGIGSSPATCGPLAVVGTYGGDVVAADLASGGERWRFKTNGKVVSSPAYAADRDLVVIGSHDHHVYALKAGDGTLAWKAKTGGVVWASPAIAGDRVYVGSHDRALYCLDLEKGDVIWKATAGSTISTTAAVAADRVIVGTTGGEVAAFSVADGDRLWTARLKSACGSAAVLAGDLVLLGTDGGSLFALRTADGSEVYRVRTGGPVKCRPAVDQAGQAWITSYDGRLRVLDAATGAERWGFPAKGRLYSSPAVLGRTAFFGSMDGGFYAATWPEADAGEHR